MSDACACCLSDPFVKLNMYFGNQRIAKRKTSTQKRTQNPVFNESFVFSVPFDDQLDQIKLELIIVDWDRVTKNDVIGIYITKI